MCCKTFHTLVALFQRHQGAQVQFNTNTHFLNLVALVRCQEGRIALVV